MIKLFSGSANKELARQVGKHLKVKLAKAQIVRFANSEVRVRIEEDIKDETVAVIQPTSAPTDTNLMELFFFSDAAKRSGAKSVVGVLPYFGYARQNIQHREGECVSTNVVIRFLEAVNFDKIITLNLHDEATEGIFSIPFKNLSAFPILAKKIKKYLKNASARQVSIVSPDQGGVERARQFGSLFFGKKGFPLSVVEKKRDLESLHQTTAVNLYGDIKGKTAILVDDIVTSGGTLINAASLSLDQGAKRVIAAVVHHDFAQGTAVKIQASRIEKFFTTDTIALKDEQKFDKLEEVSVAPIIADALRKL